MAATVAPGRRPAGARARVGWRRRLPGGLRPLLLPERRRHAARGAGDLRPPVADAVGRGAGARRRARRRRPRADARAVDRRAVLARPPLRLPGRRRGAVHDLRGPAARLPRDELAGRRGVREAAARSGGARGVPGERPRRATPSWSRFAPSTRSAPASSSARPSCYGLDMRPLDLVAALDLLLNGPASIPDAWIAGGAPFESARGSDGSDAPGLRELSGLRSPRPAKRGRGFGRGRGRERRATPPT